MKTVKLNSSPDWKGLVIVVLLVLTSNLITYRFWVQPRGPTSTPQLEDARPQQTGLYLMDQAEAYVYDLPAFESKVRKVSHKLQVPPEWLMAVMHSESRFDAAVANVKGSGATGLIQFMPATAKDFETSTKKLRNMNHVEQLDYVYRYLDRKRAKYGAYESLTDLYVAILYPKALQGDFCFTLYAKPSKAYEMNAGLDEDKDGRVTVSDIDRRMKRKYPKAYMKTLEDIESPGLIRQFKTTFAR